MTPTQLLNRIHEIRAELQAGDTTPERRWELWREVDELEAAALEHAAR